MLIVSAVIASSLPFSDDSSYLFVGTMALLTSLVFFGSVLLHELAHALIARREGIQVIEIVLHPFGGLARLDREPQSPDSEFRIAIAGPLASFIIAFVFLALYLISNYLQTNIFSLLLFSLFFLNLLVAVFNLFPGYPLDGGRVLRAYLWKRGDDLNAATILTGRAGQVIAIALAVFGALIMIIRADFFTGVWSIFVGLFLFDAAGDIIKQVNRLERILVEQVMEIPISVAPEMTVQSFVDQILPLHRQKIFLVAKDRQLYGFVTLEDLKAVPREEWTHKKIESLMHDVTHDLFVETDTPLTEAKQLLRANKLGALGVINKEGYLVGFLQSSRLAR